MKYKIDLHTHSELSHDGGISDSQYSILLKNKKIDFVAITDHNKISKALYLNRKLGDKVIIGEEIMTNSGEIIGLFIRKCIRGGMSLLATVQAIKDQNGIVYVPHPFDTRRSGLGQNGLEQIKKHVDIIESFNARAIFPKTGNKLAKAYAEEHGLPQASSSDAHGISEIGNTFCIIAQKPTRNNLCKLLQDSPCRGKYVSNAGFFNPLRNKISKKFHRKITK